MAGQLPDLNLNSMARYRTAIEPTEQESEFLNVDWIAQLRQGVQEAHRTEKPLLIYVMNGHP